MKLGRVEIVWIWARVVLKSFGMGRGQEIIVMEVDGNVLESDMNGAATDSKWEGQGQ